MEADEEQVKVFLRLRPMDKLETSKRSKDCIELHEDPQLITVESPLLGTFDFTFDQVRSNVHLPDEITHSVDSTCLTSFPRPDL